MGHFNNIKPGFRLARALRQACLGLLGLCLLAPLPASWAAANSAEPVDDVRVLIDISGSMKRTDPNNLRQPALRLFVSLLPNGANAGVWTFGQWTNMLVKNGPVDTNWKKTAREAASEISSLGLFTNMEDVLRRSTWDWTRPKAGTRRSLILLSDGLVDIAKDPAENAASRERILNDILPRLRQAGVTIHTIALSDESDTALLKQLATATGGWAETIDNADGLERLFLRLFDKVAAADSLPLKDNRVTVDKSIREATFLVFRKQDGDATSITRPNGKTFDRQHLPPNVQWHEENRFDLITVSSPQPGEWHINAELDPDNRVMVVTDLRLAATQLPNSLGLGQSVPFHVQLEQEGKIITRKEFLQFVTITLTQHAMSGEKWQWQLKDDGQQADSVANDGIYSTELGDSLIAGEHEFDLAVDGKTFQRSTRQLVKIHSQPVDARLDQLGEARFALVVVPYQGVVDPDTLQVEATHIRPSGKRSRLTLQHAASGEWRLELDEHAHPGEHFLTVTVSGMTPAGKPVDALLEPMGFHVEGVASEQAAGPAPIEPPPVPSVSPEPESKPEPQHAAVEEAEQPAQINWLWLSIGVVGLTVVLSLLVIAGIKLWAKLKARDEAKQPVEQPAPEPAAAVTAAAEPEAESVVPDMDDAIDDLLDDDGVAVEHDPDLDLGAAEEFDAETAEADAIAAAEEMAPLIPDEEPEAEASQEEPAEAASASETPATDVLEDLGDEIDAVLANPLEEVNEQIAEEAQEIAEIPDDLLFTDFDADLDEPKPESNDK